MSLPSDNPVLTAVGLKYPADGSVLRGANLAVGERETVAVLGEAGAGKSVLLAALSGTIAAAGGVWANGRALHALPVERREAAFLQHFGVLPQDCRLLPELTVAENVALPLMLTGTRRARALERAQTWLERFEIEDQASIRAARPDRPVLRRAALARALISEPLVLLADEPLADLNPPTVEATARILRSAAFAHGTAVVVFTRDPRTAACFSRTVKLANGYTDAQPASPPPAAVPLLAGSGAGTGDAAGFGLPLGPAR